MKPPTTYKQQIEKLRSRGCLITDESVCEDILSKINYYRFSAYFLPFKTQNENYLTGTNFDTIYQIYEFDRKLRNILFLAIEKIEIHLRAKFAYFHAHKYGALGYMDSTNYNSHHNHTKFCMNISKEIENNNKILFVKHHIQNYNRDFPIWVMTELFTFGMLSYFYADLPTPDQKEIARDLFSTIPQNLKSWLRCCTDLRNICAHYGRLYYRLFTAIPNGVNISQNNERRLFGNILVLKRLYPDTQNWNTEIFSALNNLVQAYSQYIDFNHIGFPSDWKIQLA
jgi:abortive infection bacteriophage resistance protein